MKTFDIPSYYRSPIISRVKALRNGADKMKKDFQPTILNFDSVQIILARHFGFCYGVENAIEIAYKALSENPTRPIFLLSQMIHNPEVNQDLVGRGIQFIQDTNGQQIIPWDNLPNEAIVIVPAFGTTIEIENILKSKGIEITRYDTTCPFVQRVWKKSQKLGEDNHTVIIHGKVKHEETRATFSHTKEFAKAIIIRDIEEAKLVGKKILGQMTKTEFDEIFKDRLSENFDCEIDLDKIGVVNQTTMLATETQEIADYLHQIMIQKYGEENSKHHFSNTRDTLCYATNDNQSATLKLLETEADLAIVVGGYNSSNTSHIVELCEDNFPTYFIKDETEIVSENEIRHFDLHSKSLKESSNFLTQNSPAKVIITSGASCPDATVDRVIQKIISFYKPAKTIDEVLEKLQS